MMAMNCRGSRQHIKATGEAFGPLACHVRFLTVVDTGSLSAAGRKLGMPLPTVSPQNHRA